MTNSNVTIYQQRSAIAESSTDAEKLLRAFLAGRSANTIAAYGEDLEHFAASIGAANKSVAMARLLDIAPGAGNALLLDYRSQMVDVGLSPNTINRRLSAVRSAVKLARVLGMTNWEPEVQGLSVQAYRDTTGPGLNGTRAMLNRAREQSPVRAARDVAIIRLMFDLGLRRGEVASLDLSDLDADNRRLWVKGKGRAQKEARTVPVATMISITDWLAIRGAIAKADEAAMFVGLSVKKKGERISGRGLHHLIAELGADVGIKTRPHGLRHASITAALDANNGDIRAVQQHARHANPQTTMKYDDNRKDLAGKIAESLAAVL
jgi:integrase/recombinase XerC